MACYKELLIPVGAGATAYTHRLLIEPSVQSSQAAHNGTVMLVVGEDYTATVTIAAVVNFASLIAFQTAVKTLLTDSTINSLTLTPGAAVASITVA